MLEKNQIIHLEKQDYTLIEHIGGGGQGVIWSVEDHATQEKLVLKTIRTHDENGNHKRPFDTNVLKQLSYRMQEEIDFLLSVESHQNNFIIECLDYGKIKSPFGDLPAMVMPYYADGLLQHIPYEMEQKPDYNLETLIGWMAQLSQALHYTHSKIVRGSPYMHRDMKPANILLTKTGDIRLIDFGIAKQETDPEGTTSVAHTPKWAAPEQFLPQFLHDNAPMFSLTTKTDIYGLGLIAYSLCTGGDKLSLSSRVRNTIYIQHVTLLKQGGTEGKLGQVGGLEADKKHYLQQKLLTLLSTDKGHFSFSENTMPFLPSAQWVSKQLAQLIEELLLPKAENRPDAEKAKQAFQQLQQCLSPTLQQLKLKALTDTTLILGQSSRIQIRLQGVGLVKPLTWLKIYCDGQQLENDILTDIPESSAFLDEKTKICFPLAAFDIAGKHIIRVVAHISGQEYAKELSLFVKENNEQRREEKEIAQILLEKAREREEKSHRLRWKFIGASVIFLFLAIIYFFLSNNWLSILNFK